MDLCQCQMRQRDNDLFRSDAHNLVADRRVEHLDSGSAITGTPPRIPGRVSVLQTRNIPINKSSTPKPLMLTFRYGHAQQRSAKRLITQSSPVLLLERFWNNVATVEVLLKCVLQFWV